MFLWYIAYVCHVDGVNYVCSTKDSSGWNVDVPKGGDTGFDPFAAELGKLLDTLKRKSIAAPEMKSHAEKRREIRLRYGKLDKSEEAKFALPTEKEIRERVSKGHLIVKLKGEG